MSKNVAVFVDVANLYYSARGQDVDVDYVALLKAATKGRDLIRAYAYSGLDPENENQRKFIDFLNKNGYKVVHKDIRKFGDGRVKANLDIELVVDCFRLADRMDVAVIVSGDGDFAPAIRALQDKGIRCDVISFRPNTSSDLIAVADEFIDIMKIAGIGRHSAEAKAQRGMSAPEMPAKEVVPEFGFREASPHVAAAALAAIRDGRDGREGREGRSGSGGRSGRSGRGRAASAPEPEAAAEEAPAATAASNGDTAEGDGRRRRRRRGGRGRGRGGRGAASRAGAEGGEGSEASDSGEITWTELDDISQLDDAGELANLGEDREYTFEEADADTLAELGLTDQPQAGGEPSAEAAETKPASRRPRRSSKASDADGEALADGAEEKPKRRSRTTKSDAKAKPASGGSRRRSTSKAADTDAGAESAAESTDQEKKPRPRRRSTRATKADADEGAAAKPARSRRSTKAKDAAGSAEAGAGSDGTSSDDASDDQPQGIWKRFRSAR